MLTESRSTKVGELSVRRALPTRGRRSVGPWCFVDHMGPASFSKENRYDVAPHPHIGLHTVTWLFDGALVHRDSLGSEQPIRRAQLNLMTAGRGIAHSEENPGVTRGQLHGVQLWVAQPSNTREGPGAFEHHEDLPLVDLGNGVATVLVGELAHVASPARLDGELVGAELRLRVGTSAVGLRPDFEYALVTVKGALVVDGVPLEPGQLGYLGHGRDELSLSVSEETVVMLLGGAPFDEQLFMWWNFVARDPREIDSAYESWMKRDERFGSVASSMARLEVGPPPWQRRP